MELKEMPNFYDRIFDEGLSLDTRIEFLGKWIDSSADSKLHNDLVAAVSAGQALLSVCVNPSQTSLVHYFLANAHSAIRFVAGNLERMPWEDQDLEQELIHLSIPHSILRDHGKEMPMRELMTKVEQQVELEEWDKARYEKSGAIRWESILHFL